MRCLISGITGTWGRAFTKLLKDKYILIGIDHHEQAVAEFKREYPNIEINLGDFKDWDFKKNPCNVLIHLAAYKHIGLCEKNPVACIENNITKTAILFKNAHEHNVEILFISTDKAVYPISTYGMSKALGESLTRFYGGTIARSGNVIDSNGSVMQVWEEAIKNNKPLEITNPEIERYFITADDVVSAVWEGFLAGEKLIIPEMGKPIKLETLLNLVLKNNGYTKETYKPGIEVIGAPIYEKIQERLVWDWE